MDNLVTEVVPSTSGVTPLDIGIGILLLISGLLAYTRGLVQESLSIAGWVGAVFITIYGFPYLIPYAQELITIEIVANFTAGIVIFVSSLVILSLCTRRLSKIVKSSALNAIDSSLGLLFGLVRGALIIVIAYIGIRTIYPNGEQPNWIENSRSLGLIELGAEILVALIPENLNAITNNNKIKIDKLTTKDINEPEGSNKAIKNLMLPRPKNNESLNTITGGYGKKERLQMERLNDSIQSK